MHNNSTTRSYHHFTEAEQRFIRRWYATARTCCIAHILGLTTKQVEGFIERHVGEAWADKNPMKKKKLLSKNGTRGADARWKGK